MKKSLIALAVSGTFAAPAAYAATANVDIYGKLRFAVEHVDTNNAGGADGSDIVTGMDNASRIGFKGSEDLGGGMKAVWQIEQQLNVGIAGNGTMASRNTFVGLAGNFGTVLMGRHDTPYKLATGRLDPFGDSIGDYNNIISRNGNGANNFDLRAPGTIAYITPKVSGFHAAVAYVQTKNAETAGQDQQRGWSASGMYENGPLFASLAYENHSGALPGSTSTLTAQESAWKLGLGYTFGDTKLMGVYENVNHDAANHISDRSAWWLGATHAMGPITLKASYGSAGDREGTGGNNTGAKSWALGADYSLSKRTKVEFIYAQVNNDSAAQYRMNNYAAAAAGRDISAFSIGIEHNF
jgi:predicted porin